MLRGRKIQSLCCAIVVCIGVIILVLFTIQEKAITRVAQIEEKESVDTVINTSEEMEVGIDAEKLFQYMGRELNDENLEQVTRELLGSNYLRGVTLQKEHKPYIVQLSYSADSNDMSLAKTKKDQISLVNSVILMSLFQDIDTVEIIAYRADENYERMMYRPDVEAYFNMEFISQSNFKSFEKIVSEFMDLENVQKYWGMSHPYDSKLGEEAEKFFKCYFTSNKEEVSLPIGQQEIEERLREAYGYDLYIEGLNYNNTSINYYCANQLISYYGSDALEEILIELVACGNKSDAWQVQAACNKAREILTYKEETPLFFSLFSEVSSGDVIYCVADQKYSEFARWQGQGKAQIDIGDFSANDTYVVCEVSVEASSYLYILPLAHVAEPYIISEEMVTNCKKQVCQELFALMEIDETEKDRVDMEWLTGPFMRLSVGDDVQIYNCKDKSMIGEPYFLQNFDLEDFLEMAEEKCKLNRMERGMYGQTGSKQTQLTTEAGEVFNCFEFVSQSQAEKVLEEKEKNKMMGYYLWHKGKTVITYNGTAFEVISLISEIMK